MFAQFFNQIISQFIPDRDDQTDMESGTRLLLTNITHFIFFFATLIQGIFSLINENLILAAFLLFLVLLFAATYFLFKTQKELPRQISVLILLSLTFLGLFITGGNTGFDGYWSVFFPLLSLTIAGRKRGGYWSLSLLVILFICFFIPVSPYSWIASYTTGQKIFLTTTYVISFFIGYTIQFIRSEVSLEKERQILESDNQNRAQENLINKLSYQIRTPLNNITGILELLESTPMEEKQKDYLNTIRASANNLIDAVNNLVFSSQTVLQEPERIINFNLYTLLNNTVRLFSRSSGKKKLRFNLILAADIPNTLRGNDIKIKQILLNILNSILNHNHQTNRTVTIEVERMEEMPGKIELLFRVLSNMTIPISHSVLSEEGFFNSKDIDRINHSRIIDYLDLGITLKIIESEGKTFRIHPEGHKTIFEFTSTFYDNFEAIGEQIRIKPKIFFNERTPSQRKALQDANILLAEDNLSNQQIIQLYIKNSVKRVDVASNGKEVLAKFGRMKYDLILMDIQMPLMDGLKATRKIREIEQSTDSHTPIIAVTANAFQEDKERCLASGMDDFICKPFQPEDLLKMIERHL
ncbi:response regulator [Thermophagus sp. OGC60D27]|uniref:response regulator n=1 Tax=Thermophagus sp. OGC60D27 TaxID=3458415 RepID=UPI0040377BD8